MPERVWKTRALPQGGQVRFLYAPPPPYVTDMSIFPRPVGVNTEFLLEEERVLLVQKWAPVIRKCPELENKSFEEIKRFAVICEEAYDDHNCSGLIERYTQVILPNIRRLFGYELPAETPMLRTIEENERLLQPQLMEPQPQPVGSSRRKLDLDPTIVGSIAEPEQDYQI